MNNFKPCFLVSPLLFEAPINALFFAVVRVLNPGVINFVARGSIPDFQVATQTCSPLQLFSLIQTHSFFFCSFVQPKLPA